MSIILKSIEIEKLIKAFALPEKISINFSENNVVDIQNINAKGINAQVLKDVYGIEKLSHSTLTDSNYKEVGLSINSEYYNLTYLVYQIDNTIERVKIQDFVVMTAMMLDLDISYGSDYRINLFSNIEDFRIATQCKFRDIIQRIIIQITYEEQ